MKTLTRSQRPLLLLMVIIAAVACAIPGAVKVDEVMAQQSLRDATQAGDTTLIVSGCGHQPIQGFTYCRVPEGDATAGFRVSIHMPLAQCMPEDRGGPRACITLYVLGPNGFETSFDVPRGTLVLEKTLGELLGTQTFTRFDRGLVNLLAEIRWVDPEGNQRVSYAEGEVRVRVMARSYDTQKNLRFSENVVWRWQKDNAQFEMTSGTRSRVTPINPPEAIPQVTNPQTIGR